MYHVIYDNFTTMLCAGAFDLQVEEVHPMSVFKWNRMLELSRNLGVEYYVSKGMYSVFDKSTLPLSISPLDDLERNTIESSDAMLFGILSSRKYKSIFDEERHSIDTSVDTLHLLSLIVKNADYIITSDIYLPGIIAVGEYLRNKGDRVDFVKLNGWIEKLGIVEISSFIGKLLVELFDFEKEEIEFIIKDYHHPIVHYNRLLKQANCENHHFPMLSRLNIALVETISYKLSNTLSRILNVEE